MNHPVHPVIPGYGLSGVCVVLCVFVTRAQLYTTHVHYIRINREFMEHMYETHPGVLE